MCEQLAKDWPFLNGGTADNIIMDFSAASDISPELVRVRQRVADIACSSTVSRARTRARFLMDSISDLIVLDQGTAVEKYNRIKAGFHTESLHAYFDDRGSIHIILRNSGRHTIIDKAKEAAAACYAIRLASEGALHEVNGILADIERGI